MIIATAGHVDHGKTSLVRRLTGIETDRLPEEQRRGMTIDVGFAYFDLGGVRAGFVDLPGHERFIHNMLVGASGIDLALIVVAADDGVMPQTREHLQILNLLGVRRGIVAISKIDRVSEVRVSEVLQAVRSLLQSTSLAHAPTVAVSSHTGAGLDALHKLLEDAAHTHSVDHRQRDEQLFRLAIDRAFTIAGTGTVVTGYVHAGACARGDELLLLPDASGVRVRSVRANDTETAVARTGERAAIALAGLPRERCGRGSWLVHADVGPATAQLIATLHTDTELPVGRDWSQAHLHFASNHVLARVHRWRDRDGLCFAELRLDAPIPLLRGDRFVLRDPSARCTIGGGTVLDPYPPRRGRGRARHAVALEILRQPSLEAALACACAADEIVELRHFAQAWNVDEQRLGALLPAAGLASVRAGSASIAIGAAQLKNFELQIGETVSGWHKANTHVRGIRLDQLQAVLKQRIPMPLIAALVDALVARGVLARSTGFLHQPGHNPQLGPGDSALLQRLLPLLTATSRPPVVPELARLLSLQVEALRAILKRLSYAGLIVQVAENRYFASTQVDALMQIARALDAEQAGAGFTVAQFRDRSDLGRNLAIDVLEHFDHNGFTRRRADVRRVALGPPGFALAATR